MKRSGGLFSRIARRTVTWDKVFGDGTPGGKTYAGTVVNEESALKYSVVWAAATLIADAVSSLQPEAAVVDPDTGKVAPVEVPKWIRAPHPEMRRNEIVNQLLLSVILWGNGYALLTHRESDGVINGMMPIHPKHVTVEWDKTKPGFRRYKIDNGPWLGSGDVFHIMGPALPGEVKGMSVIRQAREAVGLGLTLEEFGARYFSQGSMAKVVIKIPSQGGMDENRAREIVKNYERFHRGPGNWHRPAVLTGPTGTDIENISIPPEDAQFLQSREFQAIDVARWFRVPPHRVGIVSKQSSWGSGLAEENTAMVQHTFRPWIMRLEEAYTRYAPGGENRGMLIRLNTTDMLRGSFKEQVDAWGMAVEKRLATPNEARKALGLDPMDDEAADSLAEQMAPMAPGGAAKPDPQSARSRTTSRHLPGKHDQSTHGKGSRITTGTKYDELSPKGQKAFDAEMKEWGISVDGLADEIDGKITPESLKSATWYEEAHGYTEQLATKYGVSPEVAAGVIACVSPRMPWLRNKVIAEKILAEHGKYGGLSDMDAAKRIGGALHSNMAPAVGIARTGDVSGHLTGIKRRSFYNNIIAPGETDDVTVDTWMQRSAMNVSKKPMSLDDSLKFMGARKKLTGSGVGYMAIAEATRKVALKRGMTPDAVQASYWVAVSGSHVGKPMQFKEG